MKHVDEIETKILIVVTCHRLLNRTTIVQKFIDDFNNSVHLEIIWDCIILVNQIIIYRYRNVI